MARRSATATWWLGRAMATAAAGACAADGAPPIKADTREAFAAADARLRGEMDGQGRYAFVKPDERVKVEADLAEMGQLFAATGSVDAMDAATRVRLFNAQERVNAILTQRDRDRLICERGATTGSRIVSTSCHTYGELEAARQASDKFLLERQSDPCQTRLCGKDH